MTRLDKIHPASNVAPEWEVQVGGTYVLTEADVEDGFNRLGMNVSHIPLNVSLCQGCDHPIDKHGRCFECCVIHLQPDVKLNNGRASIWA